MRLIHLLEAAPAYDLQAKYDHFNEWLFDGQLPKVPLIWKKLKNVGGKVNAKMIMPGPDWKPPNPIMVRLGAVDKHAGRELDWSSVKLSMDNMFQRSEAETDGILIHEMIHVYMYVIGRLGEGHVRFVMQTLRDLQAKVPFKIPLSDDATMLAPTEGMVIKPLGVLLIEKADGSYSFVLMTEKAARNAGPAVHGYWEDRFQYGRSYKTVKLVIVRNEAWSIKALKFPVARKFTGAIATYRMLPNDVGTLIPGLDGGELIWECKKP